MVDGLANRFGIQAGDGLQTRSWPHTLCSRFHCVLCGDEDEMANVSTTLFNGQEELGDLCQACVIAGPTAAAGRAHRRAEELRERADAQHELASNLRMLDPARWSPIAERLAKQEQVRKEPRGSTALSPELDDTELGTA
jgi:hypothetical protein